MKETFMQKFKRVFNSYRNMKLLEYTIKHDALIDKALHTTEPGVSDEKLCGEEVICSIFAGVKQNSLKDAYVKARGGEGVLRNARSFPYI